MQIKHSTKDQFDLGSYTNTELNTNSIMSLNRKNLLENSSFDLECDPNDCYSKNSLYQWNTYRPGGNTDTYTTVIDTSTPTKSQKIVFTTNSGKSFYLLQHVILTNISPTYTFSCDIKIDNITEFEAKLVCEFYENDITFVSSSSSLYISSTEFTKLNVTASTPNTANYVRPCVILRPKAGIIPPKTCTIWITTPQLEKGSLVTTYVKKYETLSGEYTSQIINIPENNPHKLEITSSVKDVTNIKIQLRSATTPTEIETSQWYGSEYNTNNYYEPIIITSGNKASNPGFESSDPTNLNKPNNWGTYTNITNSNYIFSYPEPGRNGGSAVSISNSNLQSLNIQGLFVQNIPIDITKQYKLSGWIKTQSIVKASIGIDWKNSTGTYLSGASSTGISGTTDWLYIEKILSPHKDSVYGTICLRLENTQGKVWFDDISVEECKPETKEWSINPIHSQDQYIQYKILFNTYNNFYSPTIYDVRIDYGNSTPEIKDIEMSSIQRGISYRYYPGETINLNLLITDYSNILNINNVKIDVYDNNKNLHQTLTTTQSTVIDINNVYYTTTLNLPTSSSYIGTWIATITITNTNLQSTTESIFFKVQNDYTTPSPKILLGILEDYGLGSYLYTPQSIINKYKSCIGVDIWKVSISWKILENKRDEFNQEFINFIIQLMDEAQLAGVKFELGIQQQNFPEWINDGKWDNGKRYTNHTNKYLLNTWKYLTNILKNHPSFDTYLIINEENYLSITTPQNYIKVNNRIISAIKTLDANTNHKVSIRPAYANQYYQTIISSNGNQDINYGFGAYPTGAEWWDLNQESPISFTSYLNQSSKHRFSPLSLNGSCGVGETGFYSNYGDQERIVAFERGLSIAYDSGYDRFMIWGTGFQFKDPSTYFPKLKLFRDSLYNRPRLTKFNVRVLNDTTSPGLIQETIPWQTKTLYDPSKELYYNMIKTLDEGGYSWFYTDTKSTSLQHVTYDTTINMSNILGKTEQEQFLYMSNALANVKSDNRKKDWSYSLTEPIEIIQKKSEENSSTSPILGLGLLIGYLIYKSK